MDGEHSNDDYLNINENIINNNKRNKDIKKEDISELKSLNSMKSFHQNNVIIKMKTLMKINKMIILKTLIIWRIRHTQFHSEKILLKLIWLKKKKIIKNKKMKIIQIMI